VRLAVVVQRYGLGINGGAELHARYIAEHLAPHAHVEVLTTCARDYVTWRNEFAPGVEQVNGVSVRRFPVVKERDTLRFASLSQQVFDGPHSLDDELEWLDAEGPVSPALVEHATKHTADIDFFIVFSYRYYTAYHVIRAVGPKAILVPTAERDPAIGLTIFGPILRGVRALMYNSPEERAMIRAVARNQTVPSVVVGVGSEIPANVQPIRFRQKYTVHGPFVVYVGRIDQNKGCQQLFDWFDAYLRAGAGRVTLVLIGQSLLTVPQHPRILHLGYLSDEDKFNAIAAAELLIMPSYFESLSMVALEAWALGRPVLANGACDVLKGQCIRSNAGLYYENVSEFVEALRTLERTPWLAAALGRNGRRFYREQYEWPVIEHKYLSMVASLQTLSGPPREEGPGRRERRRPNCPAATSVLAGLPAGWSRDDDTPSEHGTSPKPPGRYAFTRSAQSDHEPTDDTPQETAGA
jgi:glycosyltransferase involved in cell wall biosynthesis